MENLLVSNFSKIVWLHRSAIECYVRLNIFVRRSQNFIKSRFSFGQQKISFKEAKILFGKQIVSFERVIIPFGEQKISFYRVKFPSRSPGMQSLYIVILMWITLKEFHVLERWILNNECNFIQIFSLKLFFMKIHFLLERFQTFCYCSLGHSEIVDNFQ